MNSNPKSRRMSGLALGSGSGLNGERAGTTPVARGSTVRPKPASCWSFPPFRHSNNHVANMGGNILINNTRKGECV